MALEIILMVMTVILYGASTTIQKYAINKMKKFSLKNLLINKTWLFSFVVGIAGTLTYLLALKSGSFSFVQTALSATIIVPIVAGAFLFREKLSVFEWLSVVLISAGIILFSLL